AWLAQGIPQMLTTELAASPVLKVISTQRLNDLMTMASRHDLGPLDGATATELARWAGASVVIGGSVFKGGDSFRIDAQAFEAQSGQVIVASKAEGKEIFPMVHQIAADLRRGLAPAAPETASVASVAALSPEAYRSFTEGMKLYGDLRFTEASDAF